MKITDLFFHDAQILKVTEFSEKQNLEYEILFPENWEENIFKEKKLTFFNITYYCIDEIPFADIPTILQINDLGTVKKDYKNWNVSRNKIEILTNAGNRIIEFEKFKLSDL